MSKLPKLLLGTTTVALLTGLLSVGAFAEGVKVGKVTADALNIRETPDTSAKVLTQLYTDEQVNILENADGWYKISYGDVTGWAKSDYISVGDGEPTASISGDEVNVRSEGNLNAEVVTKLNYGDKVTLIGQSGDWYNVKLADETKGWVFKDYITTGNVSRGESLGRRMVAFAQKYMGVKYVYGGNTTSGFDCSGFTKHVYANYGISIDRVAADQANQGTKVSKSNLRVGDLVFFDTDGGHNYINHVGIYIGDGQFIHASSGAGRVVISGLWDGFYANTYMTARTFTR